MADEALLVRDLEGLVVGLRGKCAGFVGYAAFGKRLRGAGFRAWSLQRGCIGFPREA